MTSRGHMAGVFAGLCLLGTVLPLAQVVPWLIDHGADVRLFVADLFANRVAAFFGWDVIVSAIATIVFVLVQGRRDRVRGAWLAIVATLIVGVSCGLPLFLALRERALHNRAA